MKHLKIIGISLLLILGISIAIACEPDDICPGELDTTPRLVIDFYDASNPTAKKNVFTMIAQGVGNDAVLSDYYFTTTDDVLLPLKTDVNTTQYVLVSDAKVNDNGTPDDTSDDFIEGNPDTITISYSREEVYVSRACGYKTIYKNVTLTIEPDTDNWMVSRQPVNDNQSVENENEAQFIIWH
ncbi:DUF6452 family protein [Tamlana sp. I1]|uniref:DUF6452 family protein n=1 Tax=Tamlana sp. I1 TaxID=2762061 RepID=UPI00188E2DF6|nr:DUF6452 family protein [Tamlana sp. I1]